MTKAEKVDTFFIDGVKVEITRKKIRNIRLKLVPPHAEICVSAPHRVHEYEIICFIRSKKNWIDKHRTRILNNLIKNYSPEEISVLKNRLEHIIPPLFDEWQAKLGVKAAGWRLRTMKTRWGSCSSKTKKITFNIKLGEKSVGCVEYIVVHELAHLLHMDHSARFYSVLERFLPDWRERKAELKI